MRPRTKEEVETFFSGGERALKTYAETRKGVKMVGSRPLEYCLALNETAKQISLADAKPAPEPHPIILIYMGDYWKVKSFSGEDIWYTVTEHGCNCPARSAPCKHWQKLKDLGLFDPKALA
jgi:hypothetical protein